MRPLRILPRAEVDVDEAADYYAVHGGLEVGLRFLKAVEDAFAFIRENPGAGSSWMSFGCYTGHAISKPCSRGTSRSVAEAAYEQTAFTTMGIPVDLVLAVRELIAKRESEGGP